MLNITCESSAEQAIHMKFQALFSLENKKKKKLSSALEFSLVLSGLTNAFSRSTKYCIIKKLMK